ncbi:MAG: DUF3850 domain-containing protein [Candidatus Colwellbacteria bacterium]|nr:DUF3850 domain-containing protein [Candidatus Colwellbacteria bacterium]
MAVIHKKSWPEQFEAIFSRRKKFDLRLADFEAKEGDTIVFEEWDPKKKEYTGRKIEKKITFVFKFKPDESPYHSKEEIQKYGFQIFSLE